MSQEDAERVAKAWFEALDRDYVPAAVALLDEHIQWPAFKGIAEA